MWCLRCRPGRCPWGCVGAHSKITLKVYLRPPRGGGGLEGSGFVFWGECWESSVSPGRSGEVCVVGSWGSLEVSWTVSGAHTSEYLWGVSGSHFRVLTGHKSWEHLSPFRLLFRGVTGVLPGHLLWESLGGCLRGGAMGWVQLSGSCSQGPSVGILGSHLGRHEHPGLFPLNIARGGFLSWCSRGD